MTAPGRERRPAEFERLRWAEALLALAVLLVAAAGHLPEEVGLAAVPAREARAAIDVNSSPWYELTYLPGVGEVKAREIVRVRRELGPFQGLEDLEKVAGIGPATVRVIKAFLSGGENGDSGR